MRGPTPETLRRFARLCDAEADERGLDAMRARRVRGDLTGWALLRIEEDRLRGLAMVVRARARRTKERETR